MAIRAILATSALAGIMVSSLFLYSTFYRLYVPTRVHEAPVYLDYRQHSAVADIEFVEGSSYKFLSTSQAYNVRMELDMPTSPHNQEAGIFMVNLVMRSRQNTVLQEAARPSILPYQSQPVRWMQTMVKAVPLAVGWIREEATLKVPLLDDMYERHFEPITNARIWLSKPVEVYAARLIIEAKFQGLRYWMYYWRVPVGILFISAAVVWQIVLAAMAWSVLEAYVSKNTNTNTREVAKNE